MPSAGRVIGWMYPGIATPKGMSSFKMANILGVGLIAIGLSEPSGKIGALMALSKPRLPLTDSWKQGGDRWKICPPWVFWPLVAAL